VTKTFGCRDKWWLSDASLAGRFRLSQAFVRRRRNSMVRPRSASFLGRFMHEIRGTTTSPPVVFYDAGWYSTTKYGKRVVLIIRVPRLKVAMSPQLCAQLPLVSDWWRRYIRVRSVLPSLNEIGMQLQFFALGVQSTFVSFRLSTCHPMVHRQ
jgi:hypothetical protein